jgi:hypothetical protein
VIEPGSSSADSISATTLLAVVDVGEQERGGGAVLVVFVLAQHADQLGLVRQHVPHEPLAERLELLVLVAADAVERGALDARRRDLSRAEHSEEQRLILLPGGEQAGRVLEVALGRRAECLSRPQVALFDDVDRDVGLQALGLEVRDPRHLDPAQVLVLRADGVGDLGLELLVLGLVVGRDQAVDLVAQVVLHPRDVDARGAIDVDPLEHRPGRGGGRGRFGGRRRGRCGGGRGVGGHGSRGRGGRLRRRGRTGGLRRAAGDQRDDRRHDGEPRRAAHRAASRNPC